MSASDDLTREAEAAMAMAKRDYEHWRLAPNNCVCDACMAERKRGSGNIHEGWIMGSDAPRTLFGLPAPTKPAPRGLEDWVPTTPVTFGIDRSAYAARLDPERTAYCAPVRERVIAYVRGVWRAVTGWREM